VATDMLLHLYPGLKPGATKMLPLTGQIHCCCFIYHSISIRPYIISYTILSYSFL